MIPLLGIAMLFSLLGAPVAVAQAPLPPADFKTVDVIVDAGADSLAAYQVEIVATGEAEIVGVEGGDDAAFNAAPSYDRAALKGGRIILAAYSLDTSLPSGRVRVAVLQMHEGGTVTYRARLIAAARGDGSRFTPAVSAVRGGER